MQPAHINSRVARRPQARVALRVRHDRFPGTLAARPVRCLLSLGTYSTCCTMFNTLPSGARTKKRRTPQDSELSGCTIS